MDYLCANFVFLGLSVLDLGPMYATRQTDIRQTDVRQTSDAYHRLMPPPYGGGGMTSNIIATSAAL